MGKRLVRDMHILKEGSKMLHVVSRAIDLNDKNRVQEICSSLRGVMYKHPKAVGLSMIQIGEPLRGCIIRKKNKQIILLNPVILNKIGNKRSLETCASVNKPYVLQRPILTKVAYFDEYCEPHTVWFGRQLSRVISHEVDHMDGKLISDGGKEWWGTKYVKKY